MATIKVRREFDGKPVQRQLLIGPKTTNCRRADQNRERSGRTERAWAR